VPVVIAVNKVDRLDRARTVTVLSAAAELGIATTSSRERADGDGLLELREHLGALVPESPFYFPADERSDQSDNTLLAELVREQVLRRTFQEVPHAVEVVVDDIDEPRDGLTRIHALVWVEQESQKGIVIGAGGR
jgi:GTP-binding protein Era